MCDMKRFKGQWSLPPKFTTSLHTIDCLSLCVFVWGAWGMVRGGVFSV